MSIRTGPGLPAHGKDALRSRLPVLVLEELWNGPGGEPGSGLVGGMGILSQCFSSPSAVAAQAESNRGYF